MRMLLLIKEARLTHECIRVSESHYTRAHWIRFAWGTAQRGEQTSDEGRRCFYWCTHAISGAGLANSPERTGARCEFAWNVGTIEIIIIRPAVRSRRREREQAPARQAQAAQNNNRSVLRLRCCVRESRHTVRHKKRKGSRVRELAFWRNCSRLPQTWAGPMPFPKHIVEFKSCSFFIPLKFSSKDCFFIVWVFLLLLS